MLIIRLSCSKYILFFICLLNLSFFSFVYTVMGEEKGFKYFASIQKRLIQDGFDATRIINLYSRPQISFEEEGTALFFVHSEAKLDYDQFANKWSIQKAKKYMEKHKAVLAKTEKVYGVDKNIITAIILVESGLGNSLGKRSVLNTLSSLASMGDPNVRNMFWDLRGDSSGLTRKEFEKKARRKSNWAYNELKAFLEYTLKAKIDPVEIGGSYAGAVGLPQFMPTNIPAYAKDGNMDGHIDLFNHADAMASIANYLKRFGWRPGIDKKKAYEIIHRYNHSNYYIDTILKISKLLEG